MYKVLITDGMAPEAVEVLSRFPGIEAVRAETLPPEKLIATIPDFDAIVVRSPTKVTAEVIAAGTRLKFIGRAGVGVDNIDVAAATERGIVVMNSPGGNTISTAEHAIAVTLSLVRKIPQAHASVRAGRWDRKAYRGTELFGKTLGILGLGRVGREVAVRMKAFGMNVITADPYIDEEQARQVGAALVSLDDLLADSDIITIHVPLASETAGLLGDKELAATKKGVFIVNCARGGVVVEKALIQGLESGHIAGVGLDVFEQEPPGESPLLNHPNVVLTPHLGAATTEAQLRVATYVAESVGEALANGVIRDAVNK